MLVGKAIYNILSNNAGVTAIASTRIYPNVAKQTSAFPFVIYSITGDAPTDTKDGVSPLDENNALILCYSQSYSEASDLADKVRTALDRVDGTYGGVELQNITYLNYSDDFDVNDDDDGVYVKSLNFKIRLINS
ncbi:MAG: DUF3168 domain-containing protein [Flavobacteriales bacterium]|nr:DUF3168 domain-containing protein [Flavobacteriales bacterium]